MNKYCWFGVLTPCHSAKEKVNNYYYFKELIDKSHAIMYIGFIVITKKK